MTSRLKRTVAATLVIAVGGTCMFGFFGCKKKGGEDPPKGKKYRIIYENDCKSSFDGAKDEYRAGERVELAFGMIATDTDYSFYVDGAEHTVDFDDRGYVIKFTMPENDVTVGWSSRNSMVYVPGPEPGDMLVDYYSATVATVGGDRSYEAVLSYLSEEEVKLEVYVKPSPEEEETKTVYVVPYEAADRCFSAICEEGFDRWAGLDRTVALTGVSTVVKYRSDGEYIRVSTEHMPEDGEGSLDRIGSIIGEYVKDEYLAD